jgi:hypothetical protein
MGEWVEWKDLQKATINGTKTFPVRPMRRR